MLNYFLHLAAKLLADNKTIIVEKIIGLIYMAETLQVPGGIALPAMRPATGREKFDFVKEKALTWLTGKKGWVVDTIIQILVAWVKRKAGIAAA
jgi:hypothetical protein